MFLRLILLIGLVFVLACSEDSTGPSDNPPSMPSMETLQLQAPSNAPAEVQGLVNSSNAWVNLGFLYASFTQNGGQLIDGVWTWNATSNGINVTVTAEENGDGTATWTYTLNGSDGFVVFDDWVFMTGTFEIDGSGGSWQLYEDNSTTVAFNTQWVTEQDGGASVTTTTYDDGMPDERIVTTTGNDGSGTLAFYEYENGAWVLEMDAQWTSSGGVLNTYDDNGNIDDTITWP